MHILPLNLNHVVNFINHTTYCMEYLPTQQYDRYDVDLDLLMLHGALVNDQLQLLRLSYFNSFISHAVLPQNIFYTI